MTGWKTPLIYCVISLVLWETGLGHFIFNQFVYGPYLSGYFAASAKAKTTAAPKASTATGGKLTGSDDMFATAAKDANEPAKLYHEDVLPCVSRFLLAFSLFLWRKSFVIAFFKGENTSLF